jgi:DNA-binding transcriptional LysR family regulator
MTTGPDWDDLRVLLAVARHGSLNGAARVLGLTQPTVSRRVAAVEGRLGIQLFDRDMYGMVPTAACAGLLAGLERMDAEAQGVLRKLAGFGARHPGLTLRLINEKRNFNLAAREADLSVALPSIRAALGFTPQTLQWVVSAYVVPYGGLQFPVWQAGLAYVPLCDDGRPGAPARRGVRRCLDLPAAGQRRRHRAARAAVGTLDGQGLCAGGRPRRGRAGRRRDDPAGH